MTTTLATSKTSTSPPSAVPALTTTFTPAPSCTNKFYMLAYSATSFECYVGDDKEPCQYLHLGPSATDNCLPPDWSKETGAYYSPGVCPTGFTEACSSLVSVGTVTETRATCCPSSYRCQTDNEWPWYATNGCYSSANATEAYTYMSHDSDDGLITTSSKGQYTVNAYAVTIRYQSADHLPPATSATTTSSSPTSTTSQTDSAESSTDSSGGLSSGAKAGIGVGVAAGVIILLAAAGFWFFRRRRANAAAKIPGSEVHEAPNTAQPTHHDKPELAGVQIHPTAELAGSQLYLGQTVSHHVPAQEPVELGTGRE